MPTYNPTIDVLLLCTANQCRSPMAEVLLRHHLEAAGVDAAVSSAGLYPGGSPATGHGVAAMADRGLDLSGHRSRQVDSSLLLLADLVIGMTREHVREATVLVPDVLHRAFTLKELVRLARAAGPRGEGESLDGWLRRLVADRTRADLLGVGHDDDYDVADPVGRSRGDYERTAALLDDLLAQVVALAFPARRPEEQRA